MAMEIASPSLSVVMVLLSEITAELWAREKTWPSSAAQFAKVVLAWAGRPESSTSKPATAIAAAADTRNTDVNGVTNKPPGAPSPNA